MLASARGVDASNFASRLKGSFTFRTLANQNGYVQLAQAVPRGGTPASSYTDGDSWWRRYPFAGCDDCPQVDLLELFFSVAEAAERAQKQETQPKTKSEQKTTWSGSHPERDADIRWKKPNPLCKQCVPPIPPRGCVAVNITCYPSGYWTGSSSASPTGQSYPQGVKEE